MTYEEALRTWTERRLAAQGLSADRVDWSTLRLETEHTPAAQISDMTWDSAYSSAFVTYRLLRGRRWFRLPVAGGFDQVDHDAVAAFMRDLFAIGAEDAQPR